MVERIKEEVNKCQKWDPHLHKSAPTKDEVGKRRKKE